MTVVLSDITSFRKDFPIFQAENKGKPFVYLDTANSAQKPKQVVDAMSDFALHAYANIHRGVYTHSSDASQKYEAVREQVRQFIHAASVEEIIFTSGTTESINLVAACMGGAHWQAGDEVILSEMEHHANIVPWFFLKEKIGVVLKVVPITGSGELNMEAYRELFTSRTKMVAVTHASNVLGTVNPIKEIVAIAHQHGALVLVDGAQAVSHKKVDVQALGCDFYAFSAHKLYGPTGVGVLYAKRQYLEKMPPYQGGGSMIESVSFSKITYAKGPQKFEAGTRNIIGVIGLSAAISYMQSIGISHIADYEDHLLQQLEHKLRLVPGVKIIGNPKSKVSVLSFVCEGMHPHDIGTVLDHEGVAVRVGHHCAMPLMERLQVPATVRVSLGLYNTKEDIDALITGLWVAKRILG